MDDKLGVRGVTWDLSDLYAGPDDPAIDRDLGTARERADAFASRYRGALGGVAGPDPQLVAVAVAELESIYEQAARPAVYAQLLHAADSRPPIHGALVASTQERASEIHNRLVFFELEWLDVSDDDARRVAEARCCARYRYHLLRARRYRPHRLSEAEEKLLETTANTGSRSFCRLFDQLGAAMTFEVEVDGERRQLNESGVLDLLHDGRREVRRAAARAMTRQLRAHRLPLTHIFNVIAQDHAMVDRLRHFPGPMAARHLANEIDPETVGALLGACERFGDIVPEYYELKRKLLGVETLYDYDRAAPIGQAPRRLSWPRGREIVLDAYAAFSPRMSEIAERFFDRHWIDAEVREGKTGGAFSASTVPELHPYVLVNYLGWPRDVMTVAHELGHGVHQTLASERGFLQSDAPLTVAETASVFGELLVFERLRAAEHDPAARLRLLCEFIEEAFGTVFRQVAMTRFEQELHRRRRESGELSTETLGDIWISANRAMYRGSVELTAEYRWWWAYIPHFIHSPFYCYAYSFGELLVLALYELYREQGEAFVPKYLRLLAAGGSAAPADLLAEVGVDIRDPAFWQRGLSVLREMVGEARQLAENGLPPTVSA